MQLIVVKNTEDIGAAGVEIFADLIKKKSKCLMGLATGSTPIPLYKAFIRKSETGEIDFRQVRTVNLDEYVGLEPTDTQSYRYFMQKHLFDHVPIPAENIDLPYGMAEDIAQECERYDNRIIAWGGIDLQLLGIGHNGHIGFNEPGSEFKAKTHEVEIAEKTRAANARFFGGDIGRVPKKAITMGVGNIMSAKKIVLLVSGSSKAEILNEALFGRITPEVPASVLQLHPDVTVIADEEAAKECKHHSA